VQRVPQQYAQQQPEELADDDSYDAGMQRPAQVYSTHAQYAPPPVAMQQPPQAYAYVQQRPTYVATRPYTYYEPDAYQPAPYTGRWYWSPQYGRWLYY